MKRNNLIDLFRAILTIFVLLYHLGLCEAGFLAVLGFFTISGYLFVQSINRYDFNLKEYYLRRLKSIYLPLIIVTFSTVFVFAYLIDIPWVTIKQETLSVIFGYNNFFQIQAESNYFIRSDASPFTHMWYICILLQIELIAPLIILGLKKINYKFNKKHLYALTCVSIAAFFSVDYVYGMAVSYYNTFSRIFSFLLGCCAYYVDYFEADLKKIYITLALIICCLLCGSYAQSSYVLLMFVVSILSGIYILLASDLDFKEYDIIKKICNLSYLIYLVQYPIIYIINTALDYSQFTKIVLEVILIVAISLFYYVALSNKEYKLKRIIIMITVIVTCMGAYQFISCPDYYKEMEELKAQLEVNQEILSKQQAAYFDKIKDKQASTINDLAQIDEALINIDETTKNTPVLLIGDSIMLGGSFHIDEYFNNCYCDAKGSRNGYLAYETLKDLLDRGIDSEYIVIHLGTNSGLELEEVQSISSLITNQKVLWLTVTNGWRSSMNPMLEEYCASHENNYLVDWYNYSLGHKEYFIADGLHLSSDGRHIYDQFIFDSLKEVINNDLQAKKDAMITEYNNENNDTVSFYGNDLLINLYKDLSKDYIYYADSAYTFDSLYQKLKENKDNLCLSKRIFILLDSSLTLSNDNYSSIMQLLSDQQVYIYNDLSKLLSSDCFLEDGIHLNSKGNQKLIEEINRVLN